MITRRRFLPSFGALQAFDAAARHGSFTRAAQELNLTQGAISRQVRGLEESLGIRLFELVRQRIVLTDLGQSYHLEVRRTLESLERSTMRAMSMTEDSHVIDLATLPTFGSRWLIPRLPSLRDQHPDIAVHLTSRFFPFDFDAEPHDAAIHFGPPAWPGAVLHQLFSERMRPVCAPHFAERHGLSSDEDLLGAPLLQQSTRPSAWIEWFERAGLPSHAAGRGARYDQFSLLSEAAAAGLGVALLPEFLTEQEIASGRLVRIGARSLETENFYWLAIPEAKCAIRPIAQFRTWIVAQAAKFRSTASPERRPTSR